MAKRQQTPNDKKPWKHILPASYATLLADFHAGMTVRGLAEHARAGIRVPDAIKDIPIGSFTPEIYGHPPWRDFWQTPVNVAAMKNADVISCALRDPQAVALQASIGYVMKEEEATLETLARLTQAQYVVFQTTCAAVTMTAMHERVARLHDPAFCRHLRQTDFTRHFGLAEFLPYQAPAFDIADKQTSAKSIQSAFDKAMLRTGSVITRLKNGTADHFLTYAHELGVFAINDMQRTRLSLDHKNGAAPTLQDYKNLRDLLSVALLSGELGIHLNLHDKQGETGHAMYDAALYPPTRAAKFVYPAFIALGDICHRMPFGLYQNLPFEIQLPLLPDSAVTQGHVMYCDYRNAKTVEAKQAINQARIVFFDRHLPDDAKALRQDYLANRKFPADDPMMVFLDNYRKSDTLHTEDDISLSLYNAKNQAIDGVATNAELFAPFNIYYGRNAENPLVRHMVKPQ